MGCTLQKQVGCFNHRVVTLVAYKLQKQVQLDFGLDLVFWNFSGLDSESGDR